MSDAPTPLEELTNLRLLLQPLREAPAYMIVLEAQNLKKCVFRLLDIMEHMIEKSDKEFEFLFKMIEGRDDAQR